MFERLLIVSLFALVGFATYLIFKQTQLRRLSQVTGDVRMPTLLYFRSDTCAVCPTQARYLQQLAQTWPGRLVIQEIDADIEREKASQYGILTLPTTIIVDGTGAVREINYGLTNAARLTRQLETI